MTSYLEALRLRAEAEVAARITDPANQKRRPSWAPPLIIEGELLELVQKLGLLGPDDKPIARAWAHFADPKRVGRTLRGANEDTNNAMTGIALREFELYAGAERGKKSEILFRAQRQYDGRWCTGPQWLPPRHDANGRVHYAERAVRDAQRNYDYFSGRPGFGLPAKDLVANIERAKRALVDAKATEEKSYQAASERYERRRRVTELAAARVADFAGNSDEQMQQAGRLWGHCCCCGRGLTDPKSREVGIGPECLQSAQVLSPRGGFVRLIDAIADGRLTSVDGKLRWSVSS